MKRIAKRTWERWLAGLLSVVMVFALLPTTALAADGVGYYDPEKKETETVQATPLTNETSSWTNSDTEGWYVVDSQITISDRITVTGTVNLILADNGSLTAEKGITVNQENSLTIWGQSDGSGTLTATSVDEWHAGIGSDAQNATCGTININGGTIEATGGGWTAGIGGKGATIYINGGKVTATGGDNGAGIGGIGDTGSCTVTITGGIIEAHGGGGGDGAGIGAGASGSCTVTITGGTIKAYGGDGSNDYRYGGPGIGTNIPDDAQSKVTISGGFVEAVGKKEAAGISGAFSTDSDGNAVIVCDRFAPATTTTGALSGLIYNSSARELSVYGTQTLTPEIVQQFPEQPFPPVTLSVEQDATLTVNEDVNVTLTGESSIAANGKLINKGNITNDGIVTNHGTIDTTDGTIVNNGNIKSDGTIKEEENITGNPLCTDCNLTADDLDFQQVRATPRQRYLSRFITKEQSLLPSRK